MLYPDLLRPFGRIHHHRLSKAVIHIRRHCFGRRRPQDVGFPNPNKMFINIQTQRLQTEGDSPAAASRCSRRPVLPMLVADEAWECPGARPRLEPDSRALSSGVSCLCAAGAADTAGKLPSRGLKTQLNALPPELFCQRAEFSFIHANVHESHSLSPRHSASDEKKIHVSVRGEAAKQQKKK